MFIPKIGSELKTCLHILERQFNFRHDKFMTSSRDFTHLAFLIIAPNIFNEF